MLIDKNGREIRADKLPKGGKAREFALKDMREVLQPEKRRAPEFTLGARATLRENVK